jgi:hypothetical protein
VERKLHEKQKTLCNIKIEYSPHKGKEKSIRGVEVSNTGYPKV